MPRKMTSILEMARYKVGDSAWWVTLRNTEPAVGVLPEDQEWMDKDDIHPKVLYKNGILKWPYRAMLPRLQYTDFSGIVALLTSEFLIERFDVCDIVRSNDTGEFYYSNELDEWMPESFLMDTQTAALRERTRILKMIRRWVDSH